MKAPRIGEVNDQSSRKGHGQDEQYQRCELCNVPIFRNPVSDARCDDDFKGKGKTLCNKCAAVLAKIPAEQALLALNNAFETYRKDQ